MKPNSVVFNGGCFPSGEFLSLWSIIRTGPVRAYRQADTGVAGKQVYTGTRCSRTSTRGKMLMLELPVFVRSGNIDGDFHRITESLNH